MSRNAYQLPEQDIQAFFDEQLDPDRHNEIMHMIKQNPDTIRQLAEYAYQNAGMHRLFDFMLQEPIPDRLLNILEEYKGDKKGTLSNN